jgi:hypothetical protein
MFAVCFVSIHAGEGQGGGLQASDASAGTEMMRAVVEQITRHRSVAAQIRHRSRLYGQHLVGAGRYLQQQTEQGTQVRFSLSVQSNDRMVTLLHVCDGRFLWMHETLSGRPQLSRVDLARVRRSGVEQGGEIPTLTSGGGLPQLLASIERNFEIAPPQPLVFQDVPVWALACRWQPQRIAVLLPGIPDLIGGKGQVRSEELPEQFPDRVFLLVGQDDLFPYRIDFRRSRTGETFSTEREDPSASRSLTTMELFEVQFGAKLDPNEFVYSPTNIEIHDRTDEMLKQVRQSNSNAP